MPPTTPTVPDTSASHPLDVDFEVQMLSPQSPSAAYLHVLTPTPRPTQDPTRLIPVNRVVYSSAALALLQSMQFGWVLSQLNLSTFHDVDDCAARPVTPGTCIMFPGHSSMEWTLVVNAWIVGGMVGSLVSGTLSDRYGRKRMFMANCVAMLLGAGLQAAAWCLPVFVVGRLVTGIASGLCTSMPNSYINEIAPPHLRSTLGAGYQLWTGIGILLVDASFFVGDNSTGWRLIMGFPIAIAVIFLVLAPRGMVESPSWLLTQGRREEATEELARMFGDENVALALSWLEPPLASDRVSTEDDQGGCALESPTLSKPEENDVLDEPKSNSWRTILSISYRQQTMLAMALALSLQFSGINAVFLYSSALFQDAGIEDDRIGSLIVGIVNLLPSFWAGALATRFGNRAMIIGGQVIMLASAAGLTVALLVDVPLLSIVFTATYVGGFSVSLGPLAFVVASEIFPNALRANGASLTLFTNWSGTLVIGVAYPYVAAALGDLGFVPFVVTLLLFIAFMLAFLPETYGKTSDEIQRSYQSKLLAKQRRQQQQRPPSYWS